MKRHLSLKSSLDYLHVYSIHVAQSDRGSDEGRHEEKEGEAETMGKKCIGQKRSTLTNRGELKRGGGTINMVPYQK